MRLALSGNVRWLVPLAWMILIFVGSTDLLSASHTSRFVEPFLRWLFQGTLSAPGIEALHFLIRKCGHLTEYAVLCILYWWALGSRQHFATAHWQRTLIAVLLTAGFAATDEFHQSFVPSRGASVDDVLIDTVGAGLGMLLFSAARRMFRPPANRAQAGTATDPSPLG